MDKYEKVESTFIQEDTEQSPKILLRLYLRRESDRQWFQADVRLDKQHIKEISSLSQYQKDKYMMKGKDNG